MNLLQDLPEELQKEIFATIIQTKDITLECIISKGQATPVGKWYDQNQHDWVLAGLARIIFEDEEVMGVRVKVPA